MQDDKSQSAKLDVFQLQMINPSDKLIQTDSHILCSPLGCILKRSSQSQEMLDRGMLSVLSAFDILDGIIKVDWILP